MFTPVPLVSALVLPYNCGCAMVSPADRARKAGRTALAAKGSIPANVFCAWCQRELAAQGEGLAFSLCSVCVPLVKAEFDARMKANREAGRGSTAQEPQTNG